MPRYIIILLFITLSAPAAYSQDTKPAPAGNTPKEAASTASLSAAQREALAEADSIAARAMKDALQQKDRGKIDEAHALKDSLYREALGETAWQAYKSARFYTSNERKAELRQRVQHVTDSLEQLNATEDEK